MRSRNYKTSFPKISHSKLLNQETFLTTDDKYFSKYQIDSIDNAIQLKIGNNIKPWQRKYQNIYSNSGKSNHQIISLMKNRKNKINEKSNPIFQHQKYYTLTEFNIVKKSKNIYNQVHRTTELQKKYKEPHITLNSFITNNKETILSKIIINHMKNEHSKINNEEKIRKKALKNAHKNLSNDIKEFEKFTIRQNLHGKDDEKDLKKLIQKNKHLDNEIKLLNKEFSFLFHEIKRYLKILVNTKYYVRFICNLRDIKSELMKCTTLDNIDFNKIDENDINIIMNQINNIFDLKLNLDEEIDEDAQKKLYDFQLDSICYIIERNIIKILHKNNDQRDEMNDLLKEENYCLNEEKHKLDNLQQEYLIYFKELENEKKNIKLISNNIGNEDYTQYISSLLIELYNFIIPINNKNKGVGIINQVIKNLMKAVNSKERKVNYFLKIMENNTEEDPILFKKIINDFKSRNRKLKCLNEKKALNMKLLLKNKNVIDKLNKIIIKRKEGIKIPPPVNMNKYIAKSKDKDKRDKNISDLIYY